jgi:hypothetical protein
MYMHTMIAFAIQHQVFKDWAENNTQKLLELVPNVKYGFWLVTDTYSTTDVHITTWGGREKYVQMGFNVDITPVGEFGPSAEFSRGNSAGEWHRIEAEVCYKPLSSIP